MSRLKSASRAALVMSAILVPTLATAELPAARATLERLRLTPFGEGLAVHGVTRETPRPFHLGFLAHFQQAPVVGFDDDGNAVRDLVSDRLTFDMVGGFRADEWLEVGFRLPVILMQSGDLAGDSLDSFGVGDPELALRAVVVRPEQAGLGVALVASGSLPASGGFSYMGERGGAFSPAVALTRPLGERVTLGLDLGTTIRADDEDYVGPMGGGDEFFASFGGVVRLGQVNVIGEILTGTALDDPFAKDAVGVEALGAVRANLGGGFNATVGGGAGLVEAYGTPEFRVLGGLGWTMPEPEWEQDVELLASSETVVEPQPKPQPKPEPQPAFEKPEPRPVVQEATAAPRPKRVAPRGKASFQAMARNERVDVQFKSGGTELTEESKRELDQLVAGLRDNMEYIVWRVEGHDDNSKPLVPSRRLSRARAEAVSQYLQSKGMPAPWREDWYGPKFPVASNATAAGREKNRRADVTVVLE